MQAALERTQVLPGNLEDWLTDEGDRVVRARAANLPLSTVDQLIYEVWLLDTEARNGGLSQYFLNHGRAQWQSCSRAASAGLTPSFIPFAAEVEGMIRGADDPYEAISALGCSTENAWEHYHVAVVAELKAAYERAL